MELRISNAFFGAHTAGVRVIALASLARYALWFVRAFSQICILFGRAPTNALADTSSDGIYFIGGANSLASWLPSQCWGLVNRYGISALRLSATATRRIFVASSPLLVSCIVVTSRYRGEAHVT